MAVIISAALNTMTAAGACTHVCVCVCLCVCVHVCDELHYTSPIGLSQGPRHSSVPQHKAS